MRRGSHFLFRKMAHKREEMLSFLRKTIKKSGLESQTKRILREKFLKSIGKKSLSAGELKAFSSAIDCVCNELEDHDENRTSRRPSPPPAKKSKEMRHVSSSSNKSTDDQSASDSEFKGSLKKKTNRTGSDLKKSTIKAEKMKANEGFSSDNSEDEEPLAKTAKIKKVVASSDDEDFENEKGKDQKTTISVPDVQHSSKGYKGDFKRNGSMISKDDNKKDTEDEEESTELKDSSDSEENEPLVKPEAKKSMGVSKVEFPLDTHDNNDKQAKKNDRDATTSDTEPFYSSKNSSQVKDSSESETVDESLAKKQKSKPPDVVSKVELSSDGDSDEEKVKKSDNNDNTSDTQPLDSPEKPLHAKDSRKSKALGTPKSRKSDVKTTSDHSMDEDSDGEILSEVRKKASDIKKRKRSSESSHNDSGSESSSKPNVKAKKSTGKKKVKTSDSADSSDEFKGDEVKSVKKKGSAQSKSTGKEDPKIVRMKRYINVAGLRFFYAKLFENCKSTKSKVQKLQEVLEEAGLKGKPTLEKCKRLQKKRAKKQELAELDPHNILTNDTGRSRRRTSNNPFQSPPSPQKSIAAANPIKHTFSRLKGIVDSEESSD